MYQCDGVGAKVAYCRLESGVTDLLLPGDTLTHIDGNRVSRVATGEVRWALLHHGVTCSAGTCPHKCTDCVLRSPPFHLQIKHLLSRAPEGNVVFRVLHFTRELAQ